MEDVLSCLSEGNPAALFDLVEELAVGSYGTVYKGIYLPTKEVIALKIIKIDEDEDVNKMLFEVRIMKLCKHPNIVKFIGAWLKEDELFIAMELCDGGSVQDMYQVLEKPLTEEQMSWVVYCCLQSLVYLHSNQVNIIHRDLKAANFLFTDKGVVKLTDFGVSALRKSQAERRKSLIGTPHWMAPEVCKTQLYDEKADIWSLGMVLIEMAETRMPLTGTPALQVLMKMQTGFLPRLNNPSAWSKAFVTFCHTCLEADPRKRPPAAELLKHEFVAKFASNPVPPPSIVTAIRQMKSAEEEFAKSQVGEEDEEEDLAEKERIEKEIEEAEQKAKLEQERAQKEKEKKEKEHLEKEKAEKEKAAAAEKERLERERQERERLEKEKQDRERKEKTRLEKERADKETKEKAERERLEKERADIDSKKKAERERLEKERIDKEAKERSEREKAELLEKEKQDRIRAEKERAEKERVARELAEKRKRDEEERIQRELEAAKVQAEQNRIAREQEPLSKLQREQAERDRIERERLEAEKEQMQQKAKKLKELREKLEKERADKEKGSRIGLTLPAAASPVTSSSNVPAATTSSVAASVNSPPTSTSSVIFDPIPPVRSTSPMVKSTSMALLLGMNTGTTARVSSSGLSSLPPPDFGMTPPLPPPSPTPPGPVSPSVDTISHSSDSSVSSNSVAPPAPVTSASLGLLSALSTPSLPTTYKWTAPSLAGSNSNEAESEDGSLGSAVTRLPLSGMPTQGPSPQRTSPRPSAPLVGAVKASATPQPPVSVSNIKQPASRSASPAQAHVQNQLLGQSLASAASSPLYNQPKKVRTSGIYESPATLPPAATETSTVIEKENPMFASNYAAFVNPSPNTSPRGGADQGSRLLISPPQSGPGSAVGSRIAHAPVITTLALPKPAERTEPTTSPRVLKRPKSRIRTLTATRQQATTPAELAQKEVLKDQLKQLQKLQAAYERDVERAKRALQENLELHGSKAMDQLAEHRIKQTTELSRDEEKLKMEVDDAVKKLLKLQQQQHDSQTNLKNSREKRSASNATKPTHMTSPGSTPHSRISDFASGFITSVESAGKVVRTQRDVQRRELEVRLEGLKRRLGIMCKHNETMNLLELSLLRDEFNIRNNNQILLGNAQKEHETQVSKFMRDQEAAQIAAARKQLLIEMRKKSSTKDVRTEKELNEKLKAQEESACEALDASLQAKLSDIAKEQRRLQREQAQDTMNRYTHLTEKLKEAQAQAVREYWRQVEELLTNYSHQRAAVAAATELSSQLSAKQKEFQLLLPMHSTGAPLAKLQQDLANEMLRCTSEVEKELGSAFLAEEGKYVQGLRDSLSSSDKQALSSSLDRKKEDKTLGEFKENLKKLLMPRTPSEIELFKQEQREQYEKKKKLEENQSQKSAVAAAPPTSPRSDAAPALAISPPTSPGLNTSIGKTNRRLAVRLQAGATKFEPNAPPDADM